MSAAYSSVCYHDKESFPDIISSEHRLIHDNIRIDHPRCIPADKLAKKFLDSKNGSVSRGSSLGVSKIDISIWKYMFSCKNFAYQNLISKSLRAFAKRQIKFGAYRWLVWLMRFRERPKIYRNSHKTNIRRESLRLTIIQANTEKANNFTSPGKQLRNFIACNN